ncbi:chromatin assembly factor 1 subunit FAS2 homolog isoform X3 [Elaeis guineensis]|uniref:chromatin assembly factor 1 subunit FAS2 homolog isoform X3 n=1 Tax=Elaeis guineensis var. tenera TaxID=51953 RepID=UPI003C6DAB95
MDDGNTWKDVLDLQWSADGYIIFGSVDNSCIIWDVNKGIYEYSSASEAVNPAYIISRRDLSTPSVQLPGANKPIVAVCFCPILFCLRGSDPAKKVIEGNMHPTIMKPDAVESIKVDNRCW